MKSSVGMFPTFRVYLVISEQIIATPAEVTPKMVVSEGESPENLPNSRLGLGRYCNLLSTSGH